ncbi:MAG: translation elongation factor Ts [Clostridium sp.]|jgi:elongation factor Ts|nr:translation elongation factor Ts [Clostridium sp.]
MADVTASMVKTLREMTGAGMMDCKKALNETNGDMDEAVEYLRKNGQAKAEKKAGRIAAEGLCRIATKSDTEAAVVEVNSETDFVAKNDEFKTFVEAVAAQAAATDTTDLDTFLAEPFISDSSKSLKEALVEKVAKIGENLSIRRFEKVIAREGFVATYLHGGGRIGVIVEAVCQEASPAAKEAVTNLAMQIAALSPKYVSDAEVSDEYKAHELEIIKAQIAIDPKMEGKPDKVIVGAAQGRLSKQLKEVCLMDQIYVKASDGKQTVKEYCAQVSKEIGTPLSIKRFVRYETGEGIEKKQENFAEEVAAQMRQ